MALLEDRLFLANQINLTSFQNALIGWRKADLQKVIRFLDM